MFMWRITRIPFTLWKCRLGIRENCREDPAVRLEDGTEKIFLNTKGTRVHKEWRQEYMKPELMMMDR